MTKEPKIDRQREHQANERTFLAWLRTSIALIAFGFAISRFGLFLRQLQASLNQPATHSQTLFNSENSGVAFVVFGILTIVLATWRYNQVFWQIERGDYRPSRILVWVIATIVIILGALSLRLIVGSRTLNPSTVTPKPQTQSLKLTPTFSRRKLSAYLARNVL